MWILRIILSLSILSNYFLELNSKGVNKTLFLLFVLNRTSKTGQH